MPVHPNAPGWEVRGLLCTCSAADLARAMGDSRARWSQITRPGRHSPLGRKPGAPAPRGASRTRQALLSAAPAPAVRSPGSGSGPGALPGAARPPGRYLRRRRHSRRRPARLRRAFCPPPAARHGAHQPGRQPVGQVFREAQECRRQGQRRRLQGRCQRCMRVLLCRLRRGTTGPLDNSRPWPHPAGAECGGHQGHHQPVPCGAQGEARAE